MGPAHQTKNIPSVPVWQVQVQQHQVRQIGKKLRICVGGCAGERYEIILGFQNATQRFPHTRVIVSQ
jgi:hypothetical protein